MQEELEEIKRDRRKKIEDMSIEEMRHEQQLVDYKIKDITNDLGYKRFRGEKIDEEYERDCEIRIRKLKQDFNGEYGGQRSRKKEQAYSEEQFLLPGISDDTSDVPNCDNNRVNVEIDFVESLIDRDTSIVHSSKIDPILEEFAGDLAHIALISPEIVEANFDPNDDTSHDDDDFEDIEYVILEEVNNVDQEENCLDLEDIFQIQDVILHDKLLNVYRLVSNIESLKVNPTPNSVLESPSPFPIPVMDSDSFFEESDTSLSHLDNSLPKFETFSDHTEETRSSSTTTHANYSLPEAVVRLPDPKRKTLSEKGIDCIFVGYAEHSNAYRFYVIETNESVSINSIIELRDAIFDENRFSSIPRPKDIIPNVQEPQMDDHIDDVPSEISEPRKGKRVRKAKSYGSDLQLYLVEGSKYQVGLQYSYCCSIEEDPRTYNEVMQSQDVAFWKGAIDDEIGSKV
ncbi:hypothetical protein Tco_1437271 [Tanacetum coccineum]